MEKVGLGTVKGVVLFSDNRPAQDFGVTLRSLNPTFGGYQWASTDGGGNYQITGVPVGTTMQGGVNEYCWPIARTVTEPSDSMALPRLLC